MDIVAFRFMINIKFYISGILVTVIGNLCRTIDLVERPSLAVKWFTTI